MHYEAVVGAEYFNVTKNLGQLCVVREVPIANDDQQSAIDEDAMGVDKHRPCGFIANGCIDMERRIDDDQVDRCVVNDLGQPIRVMRFKCYLRADTSDLPGPLRCVDGQSGIVDGDDLDRAALGRDIDASAQTDDPIPTAKVDDANRLLAFRRDESAEVLDRAQEEVRTAVERAG